MTNKSQKGFEEQLRELWCNYDDPFLRPCNDIDSKNTYQDPDVEFAWVVWQASKDHIIALLDSDYILSIMRCELRDASIKKYDNDDTAKAAIAALIKEIRK